MIVAIDDSADKIISVWEWQRGERGHKITETRVKPPHKFATFSFQIIEISRIRLLIDRYFFLIVFR